MKISVKIGDKRKEVKVKDGVTVLKLAEKLKLNLPSHIAKLNDQIVPDDEKMSDGDEVEFFKVISGG